MKKHILRDLISDVERLFDDVGTELRFLENLSSFIELFQSNVIDFFRTNQKLIKLKDIYTSYN